MHIVTPEYLTQQGLSDTFPDRFWKKVNKNGPIQPHCAELGQCWEWTGWRKKGKWNYGGISVGKNSRNISAQRGSWIINVGPIPKGMSVLHKCDWCPCVNPRHLVIGTAKQNTHDMMNKGRMVVGNHAGEHNGKAKFTPELIQEIRQRYVKGKHQHLDTEYGVHRSTIRRIGIGEQWKCVI